MKTLTTLAALVLAVSFASADEVLLLSGGKLQGLARESEDGAFVIVETTYGEVSIPRDQVLSIDKSKRSILEDFKTQKAGTDMSDAKAVWELSKWSKDNNLPKQARELAQRTIELNANHEFARRELGYYLFQGSWLTYDEVMLAKGFIRHRGKWMTPSEMELVFKSELEEKVRKDEERRKKEEARVKAIETARKQTPPVGLDEGNPAPFYTIDPVARRRVSGYNLGGGYVPTGGLSLTSDFKQYIENVYGFYGLHPSNYASWWPFYGNTPWRSSPPSAPVPPQPPQR